VLCERPNGLAQRQRRDGRDSFLIMRHFWQADADTSGRAGCLSRCFYGVRLEPVLGADCEHIRPPA